jgi:hypothetical protein
MYLHEVASGRERRPIEQALREKAMYVNSSRYAWQLDQYLEYFPPERVHVCTSEALRDDRPATLQSLYRFIGADEHVVPAGITVERGQTDAKRTRRAMWHHLRDNPVYRAVVDHTPAAVRRLGQRALTRPIDVDAGRLSDACVAELREQFRPDVERLAPFLGSDFDGWGLLGSRPA